MKSIERSAHSPLFALVAAALGLVVLSFVACDGSPRPQAFDSKLWRSDPALWESMVDDLLVHEQLPGRSHAEVNGLLGAPDQALDVVHWRYYFGLISFLDIQFDRSDDTGRVVAASRGEK